MQQMLIQSCRRHPSIDISCIYFSANSRLLSSIKQRTGTSIISHTNKVISIAQMRLCVSTFIPFIFKSHRRRCGCNFLPTRSGFIACRTDWANREAVPKLKCIRYERSRRYELGRVRVCVGHDRSKNRWCENRSFHEGKKELDSLINGFMLDTCLFLKAPRWRLKWDDIVQWDLRLEQPATEIIISSQGEWEIFKWRICFARWYQSFFNKNDLRCCRVGLW